ncbi:MAG: acyl carrier protein [Acidimicrobiales bacterium]|nr:acyl carrier protein [Acidimicrobiales bacterium]RZV47469.1 MAG: acyl carrier protein [Acidimicrobiales bacterium]
MTTAAVDQLIDFIQTEIVLGSITVSADTDLLLTGAVDSLGVIRITQWMEDSLGVSVDPGDVTLENFQTIERMATYLDGRSAAA